MDRSIPSAEGAGREARELDLMRRVASREPAAVSELVETFQRPLLDLGARILSDRTEAEDLCQDTLVRAVSAAGEFRASGSLKGWMFRIASNLAANRLRRTRLPLADDPDLKPGASSDPCADMVKEEKAAAVREAVMTLPEKQRLAVVLLRFEGLTYDEIAEALSVSRPAAVSIIHRAHLALRTKLAKLAK